MPIATMSLRFGECLIRLRADSRNKSKVFRELLCRGNVVDEIQPKALEVLTLIAQSNADRPGECLKSEMIFRSIWSSPNDRGGNVYRQITNINAALERAGADPDIIENVPGLGYRIAVPVRREGNLGFIEGFLEWDRTHYQQALGAIEPGDGPAAYDLRFTNLVFVATDEFPFEDLLRRGVNIAIILVDPRAEELIRARTKLREPSTENSHRNLRANVKAFEELKKLGLPGKIDWKFSDAMPSGFVTISKRSAVVGLFMAKGRYLNGPMIEIPGGTSMWTKMLDEWETRWADAVEQKDIPSDLFE